MLDEPGLLPPDQIALFNFPRCFGEGLRALALHGLIDPGDRRLGENAERWSDNPKFPRRQIVRDWERFVSSSQEHIADAALDKGVRGTARAGIENWHIFVKPPHELARFLLV